jgi:hypothetical protein
MRTSAVGRGALLYVVNSGNIVVKVSMPLQSVINGLTVCSRPRPQAPLGGRRLIPGLRRPQLEGV